MILIHHSAGSLTPPAPANCFSNSTGEAAADLEVAIDIKKTETIWPTKPVTERATAVRQKSPRPKTAVSTSWQDATNSEENHLHISRY